MTWWLVQWLCPERHAALATAFDDDAEQTEAEAIAAVDQMAKAAGINPWCGICGGPIKPESRPFPPSYTTRAQVEASMRASQAEQLASRALLDLLGETVDSRRDLHRN